MEIARREALLKLMTAAAALPLSSNAWSQSGTWPSRPITLVVPVPAGGMVDSLARTLGQQISESLGQPVVIDNRPGANTMIATDYVARAPGDGYTLLLNLTVLVQNPLLYQKVNYDPFKDFAPVSRLGDNIAVFAVAPGIPAKTLPEFIALAKRRSTPFTYGSSGVGSASHMYGEMFAQAAGIQMLHVPYKGEAPLLPDLIAGRIDAGFVSGLSARQYGDDGRIRLLAISGRKRASGLPEIKTFGELGVSGIDAEAWVGVVAPARTPQAVVDRLSVEFAKAVAVPATRDKIISFGMEPVGGTPADFASYMRKSSDDWARIVQRTNIRLD